MNEIMSILQCMMKQLIHVLDTYIIHCMLVLRPETHTILTIQYIIFITPAPKTAKNTHTKYKIT